MATTIYGIKNCDTMKKARAWLDGHGVAYAFHDYKAQGIDRKFWEAVVNFEALIGAGMIERAECGVFEYAEDAEDAWSKLAATDLNVHRG